MAGFGYKNRRVYLLKVEQEVKVDDDEVVAMLKTLLQRRMIGKFKTSKRLLDLLD
jgi:hypothetical protein